MSDNDAYAARLAGMQPKENSSLPPVQFQLGEAMISQKKLAKNTKDIKELQDIITELQIYVQKHHIKINKDLVEQKLLQMSVETLQTQLEIRFDMQQTSQMDRIKVMIEDLVTRGELDKRLLDKLHKREFEKQFERLDNYFQALEAKVVNSIPAMSHELKMGLEKKANVKDFDELKENKASNEFVEKLRDRVNQIDERLEKALQTSNFNQVAGGPAKGAHFQKSKPNDGELSELIEEEDEGEESQAATQGEFNPARKTTKSEDPRATTNMAAMAVSAAQS